MPTVPGLPNALSCVKPTYPRQRSHGRVWTEISEGLVWYGRLIRPCFHLAPVVGDDIWQGAQNFEGGQGEKEREGMSQGFLPVEDTLGKVPMMPNRMTVKHAKK